MKIALLGDIALFGSFDKSNNPNLLSNLKEISDYLSTFDHVIANLEAPFSARCKTYGAKSAYLHSDPSNIEVLKLLNISHVSLANNHIFDCGSEGYETTKKTLLDANINFFGSEGLHCDIINDDTKLRLEGFCCYSTNPLKNVNYGSYGINEFDLDVVFNRLSYNKSKGFMTILSIHAGIEHVNFPSLESIKASRKIANDIQYIYYGHHPHVIQGHEMYNNSLIVHSLGNFIFDDVFYKGSNIPQITLSSNNRTSQILEIEIISNTIINYKFTDIYINKGVIVLEKPSQKNNYSLDLAFKDPELYNTKRNQIINQYISIRKNNRNLNWYIKRLTPRYAKLLVSAYLNNRKYQKHFSNKI